MSIERERLFAKFGDPFTDPRLFEQQWMMTYFCKKEFSELPFHKIYCNRLLIPHIKIVFLELQKEGTLTQIKSYGGCWNPRYIRGYEKQQIPSIHSWALALDFNTDQNPLGMTRQQAVAKGLFPFTEKFLNVWRKHGWVCGADFHRKDLMHVQKTDVF